ncbi:hypothetical protein N7535_002806 [Penicillium sp. DV-2018c]|nr:hypothetical protein N7461_001511 [Penicillium sp. DV-2018c]KAJ5575880.1 hypothetical protein N7535_002806 [Penicillium sp. DV-2018c]
MSFHYADTLEKHNCVGGGLDAHIYHVTPTIVVKIVRPDREPEEKEEEHPFLKEIAFYKRLNGCRDRCQNIVECFLMLPDYLFLSYCPHRAMSSRFYDRQERETGTNGFHGRLIRVKEYEILLSLLGGYNNSPLLLTPKNGIADFGKWSFQNLTTIEFSIV